VTARVRIGVIGVGFGQRVHVPAFRTDSRCQVTAIASRTLEHAARAAQELQIAHAYGNVSEMLASGQVDAVSIAVPPTVQPDLIIATAEAGKHVFCEKPLAMDESRAARAVAAVEKARVVHAMNFIFSEIGAWQEVHSVLQQNALGKLRHAALSWRVETYAYATGCDSWKTRSTQGGGTLANFVSHSFYYLEWLLGPIARLAARLTPRGAAGDARTDAWLEMESGCPVSISVAADAFLGTGHRLEIYGDSGSLVLENRTGDYANGFTLSMGTRDSPALSVHPAETFPHSDGRIGATGAIARRFVDSILSGTEMKPNLADGLRVQRLMAVARAADATGAWQAV
jgi:predicted dehydrogenase